MEQEVKKINSVYFDDKTEEVLSSLEKTRTEFWNLDRECANFLNTLIKINNSKNVLEIGTSNGYSGIWILEALKETKGKFTTIEFWEKRQSVARKNFALCVPEVFCEPKIGSAVVVLEDILEEIQKNKRQEFDFDMLIVYGDKTDARAVREVVQNQRAKGLTVRAEKYVPDNLTFRQKIEV